MVEFNPGAPAAPIHQGSEDEAYNLLAGQAGPPAIAWNHSPIPGGPKQDLPVGTRIGGPITGALTTRQSTDPQTREPQFYQDGNKKLDLIIPVNVPELIDPSNPDDNGDRRFFVRSKMLVAMKEEMKRLKVDKLGVGTRIYFTLTGYQPNKNPAYSPSKLFTCEIQPVPWTPPQEQANQAAAQQMLAQPTQQGSPVSTPQGWADPAAQAIQQGLGAQPVQQAPTQAAAPAPAQGLQVTQEHIDTVNTLINQGGIPRDAAVEAVAKKTAEGDQAFFQALNNSVPF